MEQAQKSQLEGWISASRRMVFFGGAGVSTESGIPDFRSEDGLYRQHFAYPPEEMLSRSFFDAHPEDFFRFYRERVLALGAEPNPAHFALSRLEKAGILSAVVTQNIDGLHQLAGSQCVFELHGSVHRNTCMRCGKAYSAAQVQDAPGVPRCGCGGVIKPDVVLYEEALNQSVLADAVAAIREADLLVVGGTSLVVYPAAGLIDYYQGEHVVVINKNAAGRGRADLTITDPIGEVLGELKIP